MAWTTHTDDVTHLWKWFPGHSQHHSDHMTPDDLLVDGVVLSRTLHNAGYSRHEVQRLARSGCLIPVVRGAWTTPTTLPSTADRGHAFHRLRTYALIRQMDGRVAASATSAVLLHSLPLWNAPLTDVHLIRLHDDHSRHRPGAVIHQRGRSTVVSVDGVPSVSVADAVVGMGSVNAHRAATDFLMAGDEALRDGLTTLSLIDEAIAHRGRSHGMATVRRLRPRLDARHESPAESLLGHVLVVLGVRSTPQVEIWVDGHRYRVDRKLDDHPVVLEVDGLAKYGASADEVRRSLVQEKKREDDLRRAGHAVIRITWEMLGQPAVVRQRIQDAIRSLGR